MAESDPDLIPFIFGILFFGVPNNGMDIDSFKPLVKDQPNRFFLESLNSMNSEILRVQKRKFVDILSQTDLEIFYFYETSQITYSG